MTGLHEVHTEFNRFTELRRRLIEADPEIDETTLLDTLEGATDLKETLGCVIRSILDDEALERFPERGDHETTTFPDLADEGRLRAYRHEGLWLTVNTPKDLRLAEEHLAANPGWPVPR